MTPLPCLLHNTRRIHVARLGKQKWFEGCASRWAAGIALIGAAPLIWCALLLGARLERSSRTGLYGRRFETLRLVNSKGKALGMLGSLPSLICILRGTMSWVGPEPRVIDRLDFRDENSRRVSSVLPGLVSTWWLRNQTNVAYGRQLEIDADYVATRSIRNDLGILLRSCLAFFYGGKTESFKNEAEILGVSIDNRTMDEAVAEILTPSRSGRAKQVSFVNVDCINQTFADSDYREVLQTSDLRLGDGIGLRIAGSMLSSEVRQNVNGTDLFPKLCAALQMREESLFLLGAKPGVAADVAAWIHKTYPQLRVAGTHHGYFSASDEPKVLEMIRTSKATVLLVAFGAPRQEKWIRKHLEELSVVSALAVGGLFDFYSGRIPRAPLWLREMGLEWTYRLYQEPGRMWRRYLVGNAVFLARVSWERIKQKNNNEREVQAI
jgi:N-acetylglucosaminyldiphosphoundecaprenol N-acetyl-beta-D-mannosaminyltransferase